MHILDTWSWVQQVANNNECRERIKRGMEDEAKLKEVENKRLRAEHDAEGRVREDVSPQLVSQDQQQGAELGAPSSSSRPEMIVQDDVALEP